MLLDLFPELYERIVDEIADDRSVLRALALSCRSLRLSAQHALFRGVTLDATNHDSFLRCVQQTTNLGPLVRFLSIHSALPSKSYSGQPLRPESLSILLALLPNLQSLFLKHVEWTLASSATTRLFGARPCTSVVNLTLSECRIDFSTSLRIFLASFPNARTLEMDRSGSQRSGYATSVSQRRMDALQRWTVRGVCEGLTHVVPVLPTHGVRSIEVEIRSRESLEALRRACKISGPRLEELVVTLGPGAEATCRMFTPVLLSDFMLIFGQVLINRPLSTFRRTRTSKSFALADSTSAGIGSVDTMRRGLSTFSRPVPRRGSQSSNTTSSFIISTI
jgi:hypothetical protein